MAMNIRPSDIRRGWPLILAVLVGLGTGYALKQEKSSDYRPVSAAGIHEHSRNQLGVVDPRTLHEPQHPVLGEYLRDPDASGNGEEILHICPMNCVAPSLQPGKCPVCGMDLVAQTINSSDPERHKDTAPTAHEHGMDRPHMDSPTSGHNHSGSPIATGSGAAKLHLSPKMITAAGIRVAPVEEKLVSARIRLYGKIEYDPVDQYKVTAFTPGVVDNIYIRRAGQAVRRGDPLFDLHSAELFFLEQELVKILDSLPYTFDLFPSKGHIGKRSGRYSKPLYPSAPGKDAKIDEGTRKTVVAKVNLIRRKMRLLGLSEKDIDLVIRRGQPTGIATITTPLTGIVLEQNAFRGAFVNTGDVVFTIANPRVLWARLEAYATDFPWIRLGQKAVFQTDAYPGMTFDGKVVNIDPEFDADNHVFKVGVLFSDSKGLLQPNMLVRCVIHAELKSGGQGATEMVTSGMMGTPQMKRGNQLPLVIPETAPLITGERAVVYVQDPRKPGTYSGREVILGSRAEGYYIVNAGLEKGEMVVVNGNFKIDSAIQIIARSSMMSQPDSPMPVNQHQHVITPAAPAVEAEDHGTGSASEVNGRRYRIYTGHEEQVK